MTGGAGFIGKELVNSLVRCGHTVKVFDINDPVNTNVEWIEGNLLDKGSVEEACQDVDVIFHLASMSDVYKANAQPTDCLAINCVGTINLLEQMLVNGIDRIILASSVWVYGNTQKCVTEMSPVMPCDNIYAYTKALQEYFVIKSGVKYTILRYSSCYGRNMREEMVIAKFVERARKGECLEIHGDGQQKRCFIHVEDLVEGSVSAMKKVGENETFNLAGAELMTINRMVDVLRRYFPRLEVVYKPSRSGDFVGTRVNIEKARQVLGWEGKTGFEEGIEKYLKYIKKRRVL